MGHCSIALGHCVPSFAAVMPIIPGASLTKRRLPEKTGARKQVQGSSSSASASASASSLTPSSLLPSSSSASRQAPKKNTSSLSSAT
ncbi:unnamed protein product, partial [Ectocarpus sp. 12 AP-2014]